MHNKVNVYIVVSKLGAEYMATGEMIGSFVVLGYLDCSTLHCHVKSHLLYLFRDPMWSVLNLSHYL